MTWAILAVLTGSFAVYFFTLQPEGGGTRCFQECVEKWQLHQSICRFCTSEAGEVLHFDGAPSQELERSLDQWMKPCDAVRMHSYRGRKVIYRSLDGMLRTMEADDREYPMIPFECLQTRGYLFYIRNFEDFLSLLPLDPLFRETFDFSAGTGLSFRRVRSDSPDPSNLHREYWEDRSGIPAVLNPVLPGCTERKMAVVSLDYPYGLEGAERRGCVVENGWLRHEQHFVHQLWTASTGRTNLALQISHDEALLFGESIDLVVLVD